MKRVLTLAYTGLFVTGLVLLPMTVRADQAVNGKDTKAPPAAGSTMPGSTSATTPSGTATTSPMKKLDDHKAPATGSSTTAPSDGTMGKAPGKTGQ